MKREIKSVALLIIALFSILLGIAVCAKVEALANYVVYVCSVLFAVTVSVYAFILKILDTKKPLNNTSTEEKETKTKKSSNYSLFPSAEEIEMASKVEIENNEEDK